MLNLTQYCILHEYIFFLDILYLMIGYIVKDQPKVSLRGILKLKFLSELPFGL